MSLYGKIGEAGSATEASLLDRCRELARDLAREAVNGDGGLPMAGSLAEHIAAAVKAQEEFNDYHATERARHRRLEILASESQREGSGPATGYRPASEYVASSSRSSPSVPESASAVVGSSSQVLRFVVEVRVYPEGGEPCA